MQLGPSYPGAFQRRNPRDMSRSLRATKRVATSGSLDELGRLCGRLGSHRGEACG
jgi:hypothetical protein